MPQNIHRKPKPKNLGVLESFVGKQPAEVVVALLLVIDGRLASISAALDKLTAALDRKE